MHVTLGGCLGGLAGNFVRLFGRSSTGWGGRSLHPCYAVARKQTEGGVCKSFLGHFGEGGLSRRARGGRRGLLLSKSAQIRAARTDCVVKIGLILEQIRAVRTELAVTIERIVANQGGMDRFCGAIWRLFWANQGGIDRFCARSLADPRKTAPKCNKGILRGFAGGEGGPENGRRQVG